MIKLNREELALIKEIRLYKRMSKSRKQKQTVSDKLESAFWDRQGRLFGAKFDKGIIGVSGLQLDE